MSNERRTIIISGATDGLGLALARLYTAPGTRLVLLGRRPRTTLDTQLFTEETYCQVDLADRGCGVTVERFLRERGIATVDLLIQNAGVGFHGQVARQASASVRELVDVNLRAPIALTHALFPRSGEHAAPSRSSVRLRQPCRCRSTRSTAQQRPHWRALRGACGLS